MIGNRLPRRWNGDPRRLSFGIAWLLGAAFAELPGCSSPARPTDPGFSGGGATMDGGGSSAEGGAGDATGGSSGSGSVPSVEAGARMDASHVVSGDSGGADSATMETGTTAPPTTGTCPAPPSGAPSNAVQAWTVLNQTRLAAGAGCMNLVTALDTSAQAHCNYEATNKSNPTCTADPHGEVMSCTGFTGVDVQSREVAAGYPQALAYTEVATSFGNNPTAAVPSWIDTVFHRIPMLDPWNVDMGYGGATGCDVIDVGRGMSSVATNAVVVYPYNGQTNVPSAFSGAEGPAPPAPTGGFPSSYPISIYAQGLSVTQHVLTKDGDSTPIDHLWLDKNSSQVSAGLKGYFVDTAFLYGAPFALSTKYRVKIVGTHTGGALNAEWTFTTGATRPFGT
jgi:hypothetical protein